MYYIETATSESLCISAFIVSITMASDVNEDTCIAGIQYNITRYPEVDNKRNPYDEGSLYSYGLQDIQRTCNSEDTDTTKCSSNDLNYMEIRIHTGDWESITYESWIIQILLSEILHVPTTIDAGLGNVESLNFFHREGEYGYGRYTIYDSLSTAYHSENGDCISIIQSEKQRNPNVTCAHVIPESWRGTFGAVLLIKFVMRVFGRL